MIRTLAASTVPARTKPFLASLLACAGAAALACPAAHAGQTSTIVTQHAFSSATGDTSFSGLLKASDGNFYGVTSEGGTDDAGVIFKVTPAGKYSVLHDFRDDDEASNSPLDGINPGPLIQGKDGNIYGVCLGGGKDPATPEGGGTFFKVTLAGVFTKLYDFDKGKDTSPVFPVALVQGGDGNFYGLTREGGKSELGDGTFFRLTPAGVFTELYDFNSNHGGLGYNPQAQLLVGADGNFYGVTSAGATAKDGTAGNGAIFKATTSGAVTLVHAFLGDSDESDSPPRDPVTPLIQGKDGNLYGTSTYGGPQDFGTVFKCTLGGTVTILHLFNDTTDGAEPSGGLVQGSDGNFYGGLRKGFPKNASEDGPGGLYQVTPGGGFTVIHKFSNTTTTGPVQSYGELAEVTPGVFFSVTAGGPNQLGTVIKTTVSPGITSAATATATQGMPFTYQIKATNDPASYGCTGRPTGLDIDTATGLISGMTEATGVKTLTLQATNAGGTTTRTLTLTINKPK